MMKKRTVRRLTLAAVLAGALMLPACLDPYCNEYTPFSEGWINCQIDCLLGIDGNRPQ